MAIGSTARIDDSAASIAAAISVAEASRWTATLAATRSSSGPRCMVLRWTIRSMPSVARRASAIRSSASTEADSPSSRLLVSIASTTATATSSSPISAVPATSNHRFWVISDSPTPSSAKTRPTSAAKSSSRITGSSGCFARRMNSTYDASPRTWSGLADRGTERQRLHHDRREQHHDRHPPPPAGQQRVVGDAVGGVELVALVVRLVEGEETTDAEQHDRDDERVDVALAAVAERVLRPSGACGPGGRRAAAGPGCRSRRPSGSPRPASTRRRSAGTPGTS